MLLRIKLLLALISIIFSIVFFTDSLTGNTSQPNIILVMSDDQGWGQVGYYNHPILKTPNLDEMAKNGLRFDRFYAGSSNCSPTRATVLTGRSNDRTGVVNQGHALRLQERTIAQVLRDHGYATAHFGKWHLNGIKGPGVPILDSDPYNPKYFGFQQWLATTNYFDLNPILSRNGKFEEFQGDSSEIIVAEAIKFIRLQHKRHKPFFTTIWYGSPHYPFVANLKDKESFSGLEKGQDHYGELVGIDRSIGNLRHALREIGIEQNTIIWFNSDNGGLKDIDQQSEQATSLDGGVISDSITVGGLRGYKNSLYEGGIRVPAIIEWPKGITNPRVTQFPASTLDIFPTLVDIVDLPESVMLQPQDGMSLKKLFEEEIETRTKPIPFRHKGMVAFIDNNFKLVSLDYQQGEYELYDLSNDPQETKNLINELPDVALLMRQAFEAWNQTVELSFAGKDYPEGQLVRVDPEPIWWWDHLDYQRYINIWQKRPEYQKYLAVIASKELKLRFLRWTVLFAFFVGVIIILFFYPFRN